MKRSRIVLPVRNESEGYAPEIIFPWADLGCSIKDAGGVSSNIL